MHPLLRFFATGPDRAPVSADPSVIQGLYTRWRWSVMLSVTVGYGLFYVCRINFAVVKQPMLDGHVLTATQMGVAGSAMLVIYAVGRLVNGFLADHANIRRFMSCALLCSAAANLVLGSTTGFLIFAAMWGLNGWFQSVGSAPSVASLSQWFTPRERGTRYGIWSCSHGLGESVTFVGTAALVSALGWRWGFWGPGLLCAAAGLVLTRTLADRPRTLGLPAVHEYRNQPAPEKPSRKTGGLQREMLRTPAIWLLGLSSAAMYVARYGVDNWGVLFLQKAKGYSLTEAGAVLAASPIGQIAGTFLSGFVSVRLFKGRHHVPALIFGLVETGALVALHLIPRGHRVLDTAAIAVFGLGLGMLLVYLGGLMAVDLCSQRAAGAAMGVIGLFSYLGAAAQDTISGMLLDAGKRVVDGEDVYSFDRLFYFWIGASVVSLLLVLSTWNARRPTEQ